MDFGPLIARKRERFEELEKIVGAGDLYDNPKKARELLREHTRLKELLALAQQLERVTREFQESSQLASGTDAELAEMAQADLPALEEKVAALRKELQLALLPPDPWSRAKTNWADFGK